MANIVVLEDDAATRLLIAGVLKKAGHQVSTVDNGAEGLLIILAEQPDLVISDVQMPKMTGFEVLQHMRLTPEVADTPVILLTSLSARSDMRTGMREGADDYITKPFDPTELLESVSAQLQRVQLRQSTLDERANALAQSKITALKDSYEAKLKQAAAQASVQTAAAGKVPSTSGSAHDLSELASRHVPKAWVMHVTVHNSAQFMAKLPARDWRLLLRSLYSPSGAASALKTASFVDLSGSDLLLVFADQPGQTIAAPQRAACALADMVEASGRCKRWAASHFAGTDLPALRVLLSLHAGPVDMATVPLDSGGQREMAFGSTIDQTLALRSSNSSLVWLAAASDEALAGAGNLFRTGASTRITASGKDLRIHALMGLGAAASALPYQSVQAQGEASGWI
jgi:DNA-binding response OmpR family regulator